MTGSSIAFRAGAKADSHSLLRARKAIASIVALLPGVEFELRPLLPSGHGLSRADRGEDAADPAVSEILRAVLAGDLDCAILDARDLSDRPFDSLDWCRLTRPEGSSLPEDEDLMTLVFRVGDQGLGRIRSLFVKAVTFAGAGAGNEGNCTLACLRALEQADVCLYDSLLDPTLLERLPAGARRVNVGKRNGAPSRGQEEISRLIADEARKGYRILRLKGGDPGIFGRLAEEVETLDSLRLPYRVLPGVSSLATATTGTGILLTRRGVSNGFCALTPRRAGGGIAPVGRDARSGLPLVLFMAVELLPDLVPELEAEGLGAESPAALVFAAGDEEERVIRGRLRDLAEAAEGETRPGLLIVGEVSRYGYCREWGALEGKAVLVACDGLLQERAVAAVADLGGRALRKPMMRVEALADALSLVDRSHGYDWLLFTSPQAARVFGKHARERRLDARVFPRIMTVGPGTALELAAQGLFADLDAGSEPGPEGLAAMARAALAKGARVTRLTAEGEGGELVAFLRERGALVEEEVICRTVDILYERLPEFEAIVFAAPGEVESFVRAWGAASLAGKTIAAVGSGAAAALEAAGIEARVWGAEASAERAVAGIATRFVGRALAGEALACR